MSTSTDSESETTPEDSLSPASQAAESQTPEGSDHTQAMNFDSDIEWLEGTQNANPNSEENQQSSQLADPITGSTVEVSEDSQGVAANLPYPITNETIKALRYYAEWSYPHLQAVFGIPLGSLHHMIN